MYTNKTSQIRSSMSLLKCACVLNSDPTLDWVSLSHDAFHLPRMHFTIYEHEEGDGIWIGVPDWQLFTHLLKDFKQLCPFPCEVHTLRHWSFHPWHFIVQTNDDVGLAWSVLVNTRLMMQSITVVEAMFDSNWDECWKSDG